MIFMKNNYSFFKFNKHMPLYKILYMYIKSFLVVLLYFIYFTFISITYFILFAIMIIHLVIVKSLLSCTITIIANYGNKN